jgi:hypothetical protein
MMFKGVSQCMPSVVVLYVGLFNAFEYSPLPLYLPSPIFNSFQYTPYILYFYILWYEILLMLCHSLFLSLCPQIL